MKTEEQARQEFNENFKEDFYDEWLSLSNKDYEKEFYYWCSMYDDTKHIKQKGEECL